MISLKSEFKFLDRGFKDTLVLIPGWATDYRIFANLELNYNYLLPIKFSPFSFTQGLSELLNKKFKKKEKISLFGWSLGGFLAVEFALKNHQKVDELILLSIRRRFQRKILEEIQQKLKKNKRAYLYKFYIQWFSVNDKIGLLWFKEHLLSNYIRSMRIKDLLSGFDYLMQAQINPESLKSFKKIRIFHGLEDKIVPLNEAIEIKSQLPQAKLVCLSQTGHIPFLNPDFKTEFYHG